VALLLFAGGAIGGIAQAQWRHSILGAAARVRVPPRPIAISPVNASAQDTTMSGATLAGFVVTMSDASTFTGTIADLDGSGLTQMSGYNLVAARNFAGTDDGTHNFDIRACQGGNCLQITFTLSISANAGGCTDSGTNLCMLWAMFVGNGAGTVLSTFGRNLDWTGNFIGQNMCTQDQGMPIVAGIDYPAVATPNYPAELSDVSGCPSSIYYIRTQNEWFLCGNIDNPWVNVPGCDESQSPTVSPSTWISHVCTMYAAMDAQFPGMRRTFYAPVTDAERAYDPSGSCHYDFLETHIYIYGDNIPGRTAEGDWAEARYCGGPSYAGVPSVVCDPNSVLGRITAYAASMGKPLTVDEWCSAYNDTASPDGTDYGTYLIVHWMQANHVLSSQHWNQEVSGITTTCAPSDLANVKNAMVNAFGGTHYAGTTFTLKALPSPIPGTWQ
jgi:hypothetical protein